MKLDTEIAPQRPRKVLSLASQLFHQHFFQLFSQPISNPNKNCSHRHESAGIVTLRNCKDKFLSIFSITEKNSQGNYFPITVTEKRVFRIIFHYSFRNTGFSNDFCYNFGTQGMLRSKNQGFVNFAARELHSIG